MELSILFTFKVIVFLVIPFCVVTTFNIIVYHILLYNIVLHKFHISKYNTKWGGIMIIFKIKELMEKNNISRYKLQQLTNWNYKRINAYYFNKVISINVKELDTLCEIFECELPELIQRKKS